MTHADVDVLAERTGRQVERFNRRIRSDRALIVGVEDRHTRDLRPWVKVHTDLGPFSVFDPDLLPRFRGSVGHVLDLLWFESKGYRVIAAVWGRVRPA